MGQCFYRAGLLPGADFEGRTPGRNPSRLYVPQPRIGERKHAQPTTFDVDRNPWFIRRGSPRRLAAFGPMAICHVDKHSVRCADRVDEKAASGERGPYSVRQTNHPNMRRAHKRPGTVDPPHGFIVERGSDPSGIGVLLNRYLYVGRLLTLLAPILLAVAFVGCGGDASTDGAAAATPDPSTRQAALNPPALQAAIPSTATPDTTPTLVTAPAPTPSLAKRRQSLVAATDSEVAELVAANSGFVLDLYRAIANADGNAFFSPLSISLALAMTYAGAAGDTRNQMDQVLGSNGLQERVRPAFHSV